MGAAGGSVVNVSRLLGLTGTLTTRSGEDHRDEYNDVVPNESTSTVKCWWQQTQAVDDTVDTAQATETARLFIEAGATVNATSTLAIGDATWEIVGPPWTVTDPRTGVVTHIEANGRRVR